MYHSIGLRPMREEDLEQVLQWRNKPRVRQNMYTNEAITMECHLAWYKRVIKDSSIIPLIFEKVNKPCGFVSFSNIDKGHRRATWAFYLGEESARGGGLLMEYLALEYAFEKLKLHKLCCEVLSFNEAVIKLHRKFGFQEEGLLREHYWREKQAYSIHVLALFSRQWPEVKCQFSPYVERYL